MATSPPDERPSPLALGCAGVVAPFVVAAAWVGRHPARLAIAAGLFCVAGFFVGNGPLAFLGSLFGLAMIWHLALKERRYRYGLLFALTYFLPITEWLGAFVGRWTGSPVLFALAWGFVAIGLALPLATIVPIAARLLPTRGRWAIPFIWIGLEVFRSYVPVLAFPWGLIAHPLAYSGIEPFLGRIGEYGTGGVLVAISLGTISLSAKKGNTETGDIEAGTAKTVKGREHSRREATTLIPALAVLAFLAIFDHLVPPAKPDLTLAAYGPGLDLAYGPYAEGSPGRNLEVARRIAAAREEQGRLGADLMVMPEGLVSSASLADLTGMDGPGTLLLGGQRRADGTAYQTAFAIDGVTRRWQSADKTRLVIFGEFVPGRGVIPYPPSFALPGGDLSAASELRILNVHARDGHEFRVGPILCFEALFPDIAYRQKFRGAEVLAVMSLDDWFGGTKAPEWLELASRWRAAETGLPLVRVGSLGRTAIIDGRGKPRRALPWGESGALAWNPARE